jgi:hypothetical protein
VEADWFTALPSGGLVSPSLAAGPDAFELKFLLAAREAERVEAWARRRLSPDPHGEGGTYRTTTLYLDTPYLDIYHKSPGYRRSKYRLRRYGRGEVVHLERKTRRGDRVRKQRELLPLSALPRLLDPDGGTWFGPHVRERLLRPVCRISYARTALVGGTPGGPVRLTLDRDVVGAAASDWAVPALLEGKELLPGTAVLELKFRSALPGVFRELLGTLPARPLTLPSPPGGGGRGGGSKYRRCVEAWNLARGGG